MPSTIAASSANVIISGDGNYFGQWVKANSDFNGDGYADIIISKKTTSAAVTFYLFYGGSSLSSNLTQANANASSSLVVGGLFAQSAPIAADTGDFNGDGYDDLVFASYDAVSQGDEVYVSYGGPSFSLTPSLTIPSPGASLTTSNLALSIGG